MQEEINTVNIILSGTTSGLVPLIFFIFLCTMTLVQGQRSVHVEEQTWQTVWRTLISKTNGSGVPQVSEIP